jgi:hypothetical protein
LSEFQSSEPVSLIRLRPFFGDWLISDWLIR